MWATTPDPLPQPPVTILGVTGTLLHHPQPISLPMSFGTTSTFPTVPTSLLIVAHLITEPHPQQATYTPHPGIGPYRTGSSHPSLYQPSRNPSLAPQLPISNPQGIATGRMSRSSVVHNALQTVPCELPFGSDSPADSKNSHSPHQSYLRPLSRDSEIGQARQAAQTPLTSHALQHPS